MFGRPHCQNNHFNLSIQMEVDIWGVCRRTSSNLNRMPGVEVSRLSRLKRRKLSIHQINAHSECSPSNGPHHWSKANLLCFVLEYRLQIGSHKPAQYNLRESSCRLWALFLNRMISKSTRHTDEHYAPNKKVSPYSSRSCTDMHAFLQSVFDYCHLRHPTSVQIWAGIWTIGRDSIQIF